MTNSHHDGRFRLLEQVDKRLVDEFRTRIPQLVEKIITSICAAVPDYAKPSDPAFAAALRNAVTVLLTAGIQYLIDPSSSMKEHDETCQALGTYEAQRDQQDLDMLGLRTAYATGSQHVMIEVATILADNGQSLAVLTGIYAAMIDYTTRSITVSLAAYHRELLQRGSARYRIRQRFMREISKPGDLSADQFATLARDAGWPEDVTTVTAIALKPTGEEAGADLEIAGTFTYITSTRPFLCFPGKLTREDADQLSAVLPGYRMAVGLVEPLAKAAESLRLARRLLTLPAGHFGPGPVIWCRDHLDILLDGADPTITDAMTEERMGLLRAIEKDWRDRIIFGVLEPWLNRLETVTEIAARYYCDPRVIRYQLTEAKKLIGYRGTDSDNQDQIAMRITLNRMRLESPPIEQAPKPDRSKPSGSTTAANTTRTTRTTKKTTKTTKTTQTTKPGTPAGNQSQVKGHKPQQPELPEDRPDLPPEQLPGGPSSADR